jgi:hypothetical protein
VHKFVTYAILLGSQASNAAPSIKLPSSFRTSLIRKFVKPSNLRGVGTHAIPALRMGIRYPGNDERASVPERTTRTGAALGGTNAEVTIEQEFRRWDAGRSSVIIAQYWTFPTMMSS